MKSRTSLLIALFTLVCAVSVPPLRADESAPKEKHVSKRVLKKYDKDGDGKLNAEEEAAWKADQQKAKEERAAKKKAKTDAPDAAKDDAGK